MKFIFINRTVLAGLFFCFMSTHMVAEVNDSIEVTIEEEEWDSGIYLSIVLDSPTIVVQKPTASIASGATVDIGTQIELSCETEGATIYYTLDGSDPCDETKRIRYEHPIEISASVVILAIAVVPGIPNSEIAVFEYNVNPNAIEDITPTINNAGNAVYNLEGQPVGLDYRGIVIKNGKKVYVK